jgi:hypothetical protein
MLQSKAALCPKTVSSATYGDEPSRKRPSIAVDGLDRRRPLAATFCIIVHSQRRCLCYASNTAGICGGFPAVLPTAFHHIRIGSSFHPSHKPVGSRLVWCVNGSPHCRGPPPLVLFACCQVRVASGGTPSSTIPARPKPGPSRNRTARQAELVGQPAPILGQAIMRSRSLAGGAVAERNKHCSVQERPSSSARSTDAAVLTRTCTSAASRRRLRE